MNFLFLGIKQGRVFFLLGSLEPRDLEIENLVYTEVTSTLKVKQHTDELEFIYLLNLLTLPLFSVVHMLFHKKSCGVLQKNKTKPC